MIFYGGKKIFSEEWLEDVLVKGFSDNREVVLISCDDLSRVEIERELLKKFLDEKTPFGIAQYSPDIALGICNVVQEVSKKRGEELVLVDNNDLVFEKGGERFYLFFVEKLL